MKCFIHTLGSRLVLSSLVLLASVGPVQAATAPSFNCRKVSSDVERVICTNEVLARLDRRMGKIWKAFLTAFQDDALKSEMRREQTAWLALRDRCAVDMACIEDAYRKRLDMLSAKQKARPFTGQYAVQNLGSVTVYPTTTDVYLVAIQTADPQQGAWTCEIYGTATGNADALLVTVGGERFSAVLTDSDTLTIDGNEEVFAIAQKNCGLNGGFAYTYRRVAMDPSGS